MDVDTLNINNLIFRGRLTGCPSCHKDHANVEATLSNGRLQFTCPTTRKDILLTGCYPIGIWDTSWKEFKGDMSREVTFTVDKS